MPFASFSRLRLASRLAIAFALVCLVTSLAAAVGIWRLAGLQAIAHDLGGASTERALLARELHAIVVLSASRAETLLQVADPAVAARIDADRKATSARSTAVRQRLEELADTDETRRLFAEIDRQGNAFRALRDELVKRQRSGSEVTAQDIDGRLRPAAVQYAGAVEALADYQKGRVAQAQQAADASAREGKWLLGAGSLLAVAISAGCAWLLARSIVAPLGDASRMAGRIAGGDLTTAMPAAGPAGRDEVRALAGDLDTMQSRLAALVAGLRGASESVRTASAEIATGNLDLSGRTEQTASNLQQIAASMEQLIATVQQSADAARQADRLAGGAAEVASRGREAVGRMVDTMDGIASASRRIADITGVIDGIAFQTNILALNAAVEAARAGEQGRGFAVVAGEVRSLAQRSATASREIGALIADSVRQVGEGARQAQDAGATMGEIVDSVQRVNAIVGEISTSAGEQSAGLAQVGQAVAQLDQMTQQNAALVEESSAATESLKAQAAQLAALVDTFRLPPGGTAGGALALR
ncbi:MAG: methyl-accepting chemotaxis protein [Xylophilus ampelinus]